MEALRLAVFDELRDPNTRLPNGGQLPELFNFTAEEKSLTTPEVINELVPQWFKDQ